MKARILFHGTAVLVLVAAVVAAAQAPSTPKKPATAASTGQSADRESSAPSVSEREAQSGHASGKRQYSPVSTSADRESSAPSVSEVTMKDAQASDRKSGSVIVLDRESSSGMMTGRRQHEPVLKSADKSLGSAHATESVNAPAPAADAKGGNMQNASSNPMYKENTQSGTNPLYESKDKQAAAKPGTGHETVEYKDPEDVTTRYRPGNNKTTTVKPTSGTTPPSK
jgi:hypothetical protein